MRRVASLSGGVALAAGVLLVAPASAAPSQRASDTQHVLFCNELTSADGSAYLVIGESVQFGSFAEAAFWPPDAPPPENDPVWISMGGVVDVTASSVSATILMVEFVPSPDEPPFGDPVGEATVSATLTPDGDPEAYRIRDTFGNRVFRRDGAFQAYSVAGSLTMPNDATFDLSSCVAFGDTYTQFSNAPAASVARFSSFDLHCGWETETGFIDLFATAGESGGFSEVFILDGENAYFGLPSELTLSTDLFAASYDIVAADDGGDPVGSATASATLTEGGRINDRFTFGPDKVHVVGQGYVVDGSLSITLGGTTTELAMDDASCFAGDVTVTEHVSPRQGPRGRPLPNDAPGGALPIAIGETITVRRTGGTDEAPEAPCIVSFPDGDFEIPLGHTAWWTFTGTGSELTVDTAGSTFDTVVGVYVDDGGSLIQVGCNDDVDSLQARLTVPTEDGVVYYLQVGGFAGQTGTLVLSLE